MKTPHEDTKARRKAKHVGSPFHAHSVPAESFMGATGKPNPLRAFVPSCETKTTLTPKLRFPEFRDAPGWATSPGDELFDQISNREAPAGLPILAITQEHGAIPRETIDYHVSVTDKSVETYKEVLPADFIISLRSFQGGIEYSEYHGICSPAYVILRKKAELSDQFFKHFFKSHRFIQQLTKNLEGLRDGKMISYKQFSELLLPAPSSAEQHRIASCLSSLDDLIAAERQKLDALKAHKKGLMQQLFPREGETRPRLRFPEFRDAGEWDIRRLGDLAEIAASGDLDSEHFSPNRTKDCCYPVYSNAVENEGLYGYCSVPKYPANCVTITARGTLGVAFLRMSEFMGIGRLIVLNFCQGVDSRFIKDCWNHLAKVPQEVTSIPQLTAVTARATKLPIPSDAEQHRIASCLSALDALIAAQSDKVGTLKTHKKGLMQQIFPSPGEAE